MGRPAEPLGSDSVGLPAGSRVHTSRGAASWATRSSRVSCGTKEIVQIERIVAWMTRHGLHAHRVQGNGNWVRLRSNNRRIARWMAGYKQPNTPLVIPEAVWRGSIKV